MAINSYSTPYLGGTPRTFGPPGGKNTGNGGGVKMPGDLSGTGGQDTQRNGWLQELMAFYNLMQQPLDMNDPRVARILGGAYSMGERTASNRGIGGPLGIGNAQSAMVGASANLMNQRQGMGLQALGQGLQGHLGQGNLDAENAWRRYQSDLAAWQQQTAQGQAQAAGPWGIGGGVVGAGLGFLSGGVPGAVQGWGSGYQAGAALGGSTYQPGAFPTYGGGKMQAPGSMPSYSKMGAMPQMGQPNSMMRPPNSGQGWK